MSNRKYVGECRRRVMETMTPEEERNFLYGIICYDDNTLQGRISISYFRALLMSEAKLKAILSYLNTAEEIDFSKSKKDYKTLMNVMKALDHKEGKRK